MATTILDLKSSTATALTSITDGITEANEAYVENKIISPIRDLGRLIPAGQVLLAELEVTNFQYSDIQVVLDNLYNAWPGNDYDLEIRVISSSSELNTTITTSVTRVKIISELDKHQINPIYINTNTIDGMAFENVILNNQYGSLIFNNCSFKNCEFQMADEVIRFTNCTVQDCDINNVNEVDIETGNTIFNNRIRTTGGNIVFDDTGSKMFGCYYNCNIDNEENNLTQGLNVYAENL